MVECSRSELAVNLLQQNDGDITWILLMSSHLMLGALLNAFRHTLTRPITNVEQIEMPNAFVRSGLIHCCYKLSTS